MPARVFGQKRTPVVSALQITFAAETVRWNGVCVCDKRRKSERENNNNNNTTKCGQ